VIVSSIIAFISQKGGVGKSTLSRALAREVANNGMSVKIADLDVQQGTSVEWQRLRLKNNIIPAIKAELFLTAKQVLEMKEYYDLVIIDGPARTSKATLEIAKVADLIVQPTGASVDDLRPAVKEFHALVKAGIDKNKLAFALNRIGTISEEQEVRNYLHEAGYQVVLGCLYEKPAYRKAQNMGGAITETRYANLNNKADEVMQNLIDRMVENGKRK
jgi:chromosome partitioning protein